MRIFLKRKIRVSYPFNYESTKKIRIVFRNISTKYIVVTIAINYALNKMNYFCQYLHEKWLYQFCLNFCKVFFRSDSQKWSMPNHRRRRRRLSYTSSCVTMRHHVSHKSQTYYWPLKDKVKAWFCEDEINYSSQIFLKFFE